MNRGGPDIGELKQAWHWRKQGGWLEKQGALRIFHGPGEGSGLLENVAVDRFGRHYWVTVWGAHDAHGLKGNPAQEVAAAVVRFLKDVTADTDEPVESVVLLYRPEKGVPEDPSVVFGTPPASDDGFEVLEGTVKYRVRMTHTKHPGLFLDHRPLREWLIRHARGWSVLNAFAYTGSLSVAAGVGGATQVTTLDLSKPSIRWAEQNWKSNGLSPGPESARFISGDVFEWLPRLKREKRRYDCVILDPPSFSRGASGSFSTAKDLKKLHLLAMDVLGGAGVLVTSINSANVTWSRYEAEVLGAAREKGMSFDILKSLHLPETFPTTFGRPEERYLKGWIMKLRPARSG